MTTCLPGHEPLASTSKCRMMSVYLTELPLTRSKAMKERASWLVNSLKTTRIKFMRHRCRVQNGDRERMLHIMARTIIVTTTGTALVSATKITMTMNTRAYFTQRLLVFRTDASNEGGTVCAIRCKVVAVYVPVISAAITRCPSLVVLTAAVSASLEARDQ